MNKNSSQNCIEFQPGANLYLKLTGEMVLLRYTEVKPKCGV